MLRPNPASASAVGNLLSVSASAPAIRYPPYFFAPENENEL